MELTDYIRILRKSWLIIVLATILGVGVAAAYSLTRTPLYEAQSTVFVSSQAGGSIAELQQGSNFTQSRVTTYANLVTTPIVMNPVIAELDLGMTSIELSKAVTASSALNTTLITITVENPSAIAAADIANALGASLTAAVETIETPNGADTSPVRLTRVKDAVPALSPSSPNVPLNLALGALVGLAIGIGIAVLRSVLDNRVRTPRDVEQITDRPLIGAIAFDPKAKDRPLIVHANPLSPLAESFRALRTNLQFLDMGGRSSFVITSSVPSEGKSTTTINLAIALADSGRRVALLDTDLRKPKVADYLGIEGGVGLTDVLIGRARVGDVMLPWGGRSLYVLPAGKIPPNPSELLGSKHMHTLLEVLERDFDVVLCDAPPLLPVTDAAILAKSTSGAIVMASAGRTTRHQLESAIDALQTVDAKIAGIVMTMVPTRGPDSYAYGYGYGYHEEPARKKKGKGIPTPAPVPPPAPVEAAPVEAAPADARTRRDETPAPASPVAPPTAAVPPPPAPRTQRDEPPAPVHAPAPPAAPPLVPQAKRDETPERPPVPATTPDSPLTLDDIIAEAGGSPKRPEPLI
nr:polysaccharide biosynthesis tyrosine autokinase [Microbacterium sp. SS28]